MKADYQIHGGWGNHIDWMGVDWGKTDLNDDPLLPVHGHMPNIPEVGDTFMCEFQRSFIKFEFVEINRMSDPPDQFFGKVRVIDQEMKMEVK